MNIAFSPNRPWVLLAEDEPIVRELLVTILEECGCTVDAVNDGVQAIKRLAGNELPYQLLVTDIQMPGMSGLDVIAWLRAEGRAMPVIVVSVESGKYRLEDLRIGSSFAGKLPKPFPPQALIRMVAEALAPQSPETDAV
jgi:CheY-like chemotaxis protein